MRLPTIIALVSCVALAALLAWPVRTSTIRVAIALTALVAVTAVTIRTWPARHLGKGILAAGVATSAWTAATLTLHPVHHTLACLDGERWIQASPGDGAVTIRHRTEPDPWFAVPVRLYRLRR